MRFSIQSLLLLCVVLVMAGCASGPQVVYVSEAQEVTTAALEPVSIDGTKLRKDIAKWSGFIASEREDDILSIVNRQIANTKRFSVVQESDTISVGKNYIIEPRIEELKGPELINIPTDPTRKKVEFKARVKLDVKSVDANGEKIHKSYGDSRINDFRISEKQLPISKSKQADYIFETIEVAFTAASNKLGMAFNPSYVFGKVSGVNGKTAHVSINTSKLAKMPAMKRKLEVVDDTDNNKIIAVIEGVKVDNGSATGTVFEKSGAVKEGARVRAQVNDLQE